MTKLDVLDGLDEIRICIGYDTPNGRLQSVPTGAELLARPTHHAADRGTLIHKWFEQIEWLALPVCDHAPGPFHHRHQGQKIMRCHIRLGHEFHMAG